MDIIQSINCFLVQNISSHGSIVLYQNRLVFVYDNGTEDTNFDFDYSEISQIKAELGFLQAMDSLEIEANEQLFRFTGVKDVENVKSMINLIKQHNSKPKLSYGFRSTGAPKVQWKDLDDPILLCSCTLPANMATVTQVMLSRDFFVELYASFESENIVIDEWKQKEGYQERTIHYQKVINIPFMGKSIIQIGETQLLFNLPNKMAIQVVSNLGKTPYASCFDPQVQIVFEDKGETVDFVVKFKLVWLSEPAFKSIIDSRTTDANRIFYVGFEKQLIRELGGEDPDDKKKKDEDKKSEKTDEKNADEQNNNKNEESPADGFAKFRRIYKIIIILLILSLIVAFHRRYRKKESYFFSFWKFLTFSFYIALLVLF